MAIRARVQRAHGDIDGSIATTREAIAQRIALSGHDNRETALLFNSLAIALATVNRLPEALKANYETTAIYRALGLGDGLDAQIIVANTGTLGNARWSFARGGSAPEEFGGAGTSAGGRLRRGRRRDELLRADTLDHESQ